MPLLKRATSQVDVAATVTENTPVLGIQTSTSVKSEAPLAAAKARAAKASSDVPLSKEGYWERKEVRDIRTGECIRLSGILQALLGSVNYGQYLNTSSDANVDLKAAYLAQVKKDAKELAKFVTEEA